MLSTIIFFHESFTNIITITFTALVITELLNVYSEVNPSSHLHHSTLIDKQAQLENVRGLPPDLRLLHPEHFPVAFILRHVLPDLALLPQSPRDHLALLAASPHPEVPGQQVRPHRTTEDTQTREKVNVLLNVLLVDN